MAKGSIEKRGDNSWRFTVELGINALGERDRERKTITVDDPVILRAPKRLREYLENELAKFKIEIESGEFKKPEKIKFVDLAKIWREKHAPTHYSPRTFINYSDRLDTHIVPYFERMFLDEIKPLHVLEFKNYLSKPEARLDGKEGPLSLSAQLFIFKVFTALMKFSTEELKIIAENPAKAVSPPKVPKKKRKQKNVYGEDEAMMAVIALLSLPTLWRLYFFGAMFGGLRRGELIALEWPDVDYEQNQLFIQHSISWTEKGEAMIKGTKEDNEEWVDMPKWYMRELKAFQIACEEERKNIPSEMWQGGDRQYVFHSGFGKPYYHDTPTGTWRKFLQKNNLKNIRLHDLRHTAATLLLEDGVDLKYIQEFLRHAKIETTGDFYAHVTSKASRGVADRFDKFDPMLLGDAMGTERGQDTSVSILNNLIRPFQSKRKI